MMLMIIAVQLDECRADFIFISFLLTLNQQSPIVGFFVSTPHTLIHLHTSTTIKCFLKAESRAIARR
eukprot:m.889752 g.889752  ORF g.889752 m.889752 type:complete len:67 (-) comp59947_c0_seq3:3727-3927(-)